MARPYVHNKTNYTLEIKFIDERGLWSGDFYSLRPGQKIFIPRGRWYVFSRRLGDRRWRLVREKQQMIFDRKKPKKKKKKIRKKPKAKARKKTKRNPRKKYKTNPRKKKKTKVSKKAKVKRRKKTKKKKRTKKSR